MSIKIMQQVWESAPVSGGTLLVLLALADSADDKLRSCFPGIESLAHKARLSERQVKRAIAELCEVGIISVERNASPYKTNLYTVRQIETWPRGDNMSPTPEASDVTFATTGGDTHVPSDGTPMSPKPLVTSDQPSDLFGSSEPQSQREVKIEEDRAMEFWEAYPRCKRKTDRIDALKVFRRIVAGKHRDIPKTDPEIIIAAVRRYAQAGDDPEYMPLPTTWLNNARWEQYPPPVIAAARPERYVYHAGGVVR